MLSPKRRAELKHDAQSIEVVAHVGKFGITESVLESVEKVLKARELIKIAVLESCEATTKEVAESLSNTLKADIVQVIGGKIVLYKINPNKKKPTNPKKK
ncbi:MAG: YhbY family RNA-binding protein [Clostridia bacterium]|nr:YhbY family RNA-binding protein [Clostridia bacterium]